MKSFMPNMKSDSGMRETPGFPEEQSGGMFSGASMNTGSFLSGGGDGGDSGDDVFRTQSGDRSALLRRLLAFGGRVILFSVVIALLVINRELILNAAAVFAVGAIIGVLIGTRVLRLHHGIGNCALAGGAAALFFTANPAIGGNLLSRMTGMTFGILDLIAPILLICLGLRILIKSLR